VVAEVADTAAQAARAAPDPVASLRAGFAAWLQLALESGVQRIALLDPLAVVSWTRCREIDEQHILGGLRASMRRIAKQGRLPPATWTLLAHMLLAAVNKAALLVARAEDPPAALQTGQAAVGALIDRLTGDPPASSSTRVPTYWSRRASRGPGWSARHAPQRRRVVLRVPIEGAIELESGTHRSRSGIH
jgi:hypothetical protein